jgi:hypothetical protein
LGKSGTECGKIDVNLAEEMVKKYGSASGTPEKVLWRWTRGTSKAMGIVLDLDAHLGQQG